MTRKERKKAIEVLDDMKVKIGIPKAAKMQNDKNWALDMAIKALSQEPCDDCIFEEGSKYCVEHCPYEAEANKSCEGAISREKALEPYKGLNDDDVISVRLIKKNITELPPVTPSRRKGHWVHKGQGIYCSECGKESGYNPFGASRFSDYCPSCGIEMESKE